MRRLLFLLPLLLFLGVGAYFLWGLDPARDPKLVPSVMIDRAVPAFDLPPLAGWSEEGLAAADLARGKVTLVNFFASWCVPCRVEHPYLAALARRGDLQVVGINYKDTPEAAGAFLEELGNPYARIGVDSGRAAIEWGVYGVPESFLVDGRGRLRYNFRGPLHPQLVEREILPLVEALSRQ